MPTAHRRNLLDYLTAIGPILGVIAALIVGFVQAYLQRKQLHQNLYSKRFTVFGATQTYLALLIQTAGKYELDWYAEFRRNTHDAEFLFPPEVWQYIESIGSIGLDLRRFWTEIEHYERLLHPALIPVETDPQYQQALERHP